MIHPIIVDAKGKIYNDYPNGVKNVWRHLRNTFNNIFNAPLRPEVFYMTREDYNDIVKWGSETDI
jgi:hypothetical protein